MRMILFAFALSTGMADAAPPRVVDGDTLELDGVVYRLHGIDAPEHGQRCGDWACGADATDALAEMIRGKDVRCAVIEEDIHGRMIATCQADGHDLSAAMVDKGLAWAFTRYSDTYRAQELVSREKAEGVLSDSFTPPWEFRTNRWKQAQANEQKAPPDCPIKGNISHNSGARIYHAPWSPWYDRVYVNPEKGERWFCSEGEALAAGWRAPRWK